MDLRDTRFILYEQLNIEDLCEANRFQDHSRETFEMILSAAEKLAVNDFAPANSSGDKVGCQWQDNRVTVPEFYRAPFQKFCEGGWMSLRRIMMSADSMFRFRFTTPAARCFLPRIIP